jgi:hypothetical protein
MADYYSVVARAVSGLPSKTDEARRAVYERARTALQERLRTLDPPISETELANEQFALEAAIRRVEMESLFSDMRRGAREEATAGLAQGVDFVQRTQLKVKKIGRSIFLNIFGKRF